MARLAARIYGNALFLLAKEKQMTEVLCKEAEYLAAVWKRYPDFARLMNHPQISREDKIHMLEAIFKGRVSDDMIGFLHVIIRKDRYREILMILKCFIGQIGEYKKAGTAFVASALELTEEQKHGIEKRLKDVTGYESFQMYYSVDASLIGGLVIQVNGRVVDSSLKTQMERLHRQLNRLQLSPELQ